MKRLTAYFLILSFPLISFGHGGEGHGTYRPDWTKTREWNTGGRLVREVFQCAKCHAPRAREDSFDINAPLTGYHGPNITQDRLSGIGTWSVEQIASFLFDGMTPPPMVDYVGGEMSHVIRETSKLTPEQRRAMALYLKDQVAAPSTQIQHGGTFEDAQTTTGAEGAR